MKNYLNDYKEEIEKKLEKKITKEDIKNHITKIKLFQHERLIHLLVTLFFAIFLLITMYMSLTQNLFIYISLILLIMLIFYIKHYLFLENNIQYLYKKYDEMINKLNK